VKLYRYHLNWDRTSLTREEFEVVKTTPCGVWITDDRFKPRFINLQRRKQWANKTPEEALEAFKARKRRQIKILFSQLLEAKKALAVAEGTSLAVLQLPESSSFETCFPNLP